MIIAIQNTIGAIGRGLGIVTRNLQMWLGFTEANVIGSNQFVLDKSTNSNNAKLFTGKALEFNGNDKVDLGTTFGLTGEFTVAFWVNLTNYTQAVIVGDSANEDWFRINSATQYTLKINNSSSINIVSGGSIPLSSWSRIALIRDSNNLVTLSINGIIYTNNAPTKSGDFDFTLIGSKSGTFINGLLSNVQIYNKAWVSDDAAFDYANPNNLVFNNSASSISLSNLKGYYALSEGSGSIAYDSATSLGSDVINLNFQSNWQAISGAVVDNQYKFSTVGAGGQIRINSILTQGSIYQVNISGTTTAALLRFRSYSGDATYLTHSGGGSFSDSFIITSEDLGVRFRANNSSVTTLTTLTLKEISAGTITGATYDDKQPTIPQLGMVDWAKSTPDETNEVTLIEAPNDLGKDVLGNSLRLREGGFNLDGIGYAEVADDSTLDFGTGDFSIETWVKASVGSGSLSVIVSLGGNFNGNNSAGIATHKPSGKFISYIGSSAMYSNGVFVVGDWYHLVITRDSNTCTLYVDTVAQSDTETNTNSITNALVKQLGRDTSTDRFYTDVIDDTRMYNIALSQKEIINNYKIGLSKHS